MLTYLECIWIIKFFFFFYFIFKLCIIVLVLPKWISKWIRHRYTCVPHPEPSSLLPPHTLPLGRPSAPAPSIQHRVTYLSTGSLWRHTFLASPFFPFQSCFLCNLYPTKNRRHWAQFSRQVNQLFINLKKIHRSLASELKIRINTLSLCPLLTCKLLIPLVTS